MTIRRGPMATASAAMRKRTGRYFPRLREIFANITNDEKKIAGRYSREKLLDFYALKSYFFRL